MLTFSLGWDEGVVSNETRRESEAGYHQRFCVWGPVRPDIYSPMISIADQYPGHFLA